MPILPRFPFYVESFPKSDSAAYYAGVREGDRILAINGASTEFFDQFKSEITKYKDQNITLTILRDENDTLNLIAPVSEKSTIGVFPDINFERYFTHEKKKYTLLASVPAGILKGYNTASSYLKSLKLLFKPETKAYEELGGFIKIGSIFPGVWDWQAFWSLTAFLSLILAIMNILPIPALDGGHVTFLLYEIITGRKPSDKFMENAQIVGMLILLTLLVYANGNDIIGLFKK